MNSPRILIIEDDEAVRRGLVDALTYHGYRTFEASDGTQGRDKAVKVACDFILLDLVLPGLDGLEILKEVRETRPALPVLILTARGEEEERVRGLQMGADDYVVKPFSVKELIARVEAILRRSPERPSDVHRLDLPAGVADFDRAEVRFENGEKVELSEREAELLRYFAANSGRVISRDEILSRVWRMNPAGLYTRTVDMHVARLREKLGDDPSHPRVIVTVRGRGYMLARGEESP